VQLRLELAPATAPIFELVPERKELSRDADGVVCALGWWSGDEGWVDVPDTARFRFVPGEANLLAVPAPGADQESILDSFFGTALPIALQATSDHEVVHGSAVLTPRGVIAYCGFSGVGKTTVAHALAARGFELWADDAVAMRIDPSGQARSTSLPFTANLRPESRSFLGEGTVVATAEPWQTASLAALVLLEPSDERPGVRITRESSPARALHSLLPNAYRFVPRTAGERRETVAAYLELASQVPVYRAVYMRGFDRLALLLDELERTVGLRASG